MIGRRCVVVLVFATLAAGCRERKLGASRPAPPPIPTMTLSGILHEGYSGEVIRDGNMVLAQSSKDVHTTPVDSDGRFRFEVPASELFLSMRWKAPQALDPRWVQSTPMGGYVRVPQGRKEQAVDFGRVTVWLPEKAEELFAAVCTSRSPSAPTLPFTGFLPLFNKGESFRYWSYGDMLTDAWPEGWSGVLCVSETTVKVGSYLPHLDGYDTIWKVRLVRSPEGRVLNKTLRTSPPDKIDFGSGSKIITTDPMPKLAEWLKGLEPAAPRTPDP